jgi:FkbM family methyltransferase
MGFSDSIFEMVAFSPATKVLARHLPVRGGARIVLEAYGRTNIRPESTIATSIFGDIFNVDFNSFLEWQVWAFGTYEAELGRLLGAIISQNENCIDVGANIGIHTIRMAKSVGSGGNVIAIEADAGLSNRLKANVELNSLTNVNVVQVAAAAVDGEVVTLNRPEDEDSNKARASLIRHMYLTGKSQSVRTVTIDNAANGREIDFIKIDVEGAEIDVLRGATETIDRCRPTIVFEYSSDHVKEGMSPIVFLQEIGYSLQEIRNVRNRVTGRGHLSVTPLIDVPSGCVNILALSDSKERGSAGL